MENEKKYKEEVVRATKLWERGDITRENLEYIFPELKESEDERMLRVLREGFNILDKDDEWYSGITNGQILVWLEKQGNIDLEFFESGENEKREFVGYGFLKCKGDFLSFKEGETYWLEYVGKDNYNVRSDNLLGQTFHITPQQLYTVFRPTTWLEKQGENPQGKSAFSIKDAKDGDVLASGHLVFIFKVIHGVWLNCHCSAHNDGSFIADSYDLMTNKYFSEVHPATKEQRDFLFAKMKEAGYEWDAEKKVMKKFIEEKSPAESLGISPEKYEEIVNECIYGESTDKAEPKFHEGEWVVDNNGKVAIIYDLQKAGYVGHYADGADFVCKYGNEHLFHSWTIQDAKDGDVLVASDGSLFIFSKVKNNCAYYHFSLLINGSREISDGKHAWETASACHPATKEQCDLLFQKMKEAGYEWNDEKKELNKIEQKSKWSNEDEERLQSCISALQGKGFMGGVDTMDSKWLKSLKQRMEEHEKQDVQNLASSAKPCENDTLYDLLNKMPSCITVDGIDYHFVLKKTIVYMAFYEGEGEGSGKVIFWMAGNPIDLLTAMLKKLKAEGLLDG